MIQWIRGASARVLFGLVTLAPILVLLSLLAFAPPDGNERAQFMQFLGRFHPPSVHIPIALLLLVPLLELAGRNRRFPYLLPAADFVLGVATLGAIGAASLGWCLARSGGYSGPLVTQHMWAGVCVAGAAWLCWILRGSENSLARERIYLIVLAGTVGLVSFTGYRGGQLSQGENHLTEFMPAPLSRLLGVADEEPASNSPNGGPNTFYGARIQPVLARQCVTCHGRSKHKSNLRLDSFDALMRGGKHGAVIKGGELKSELLRRIKLPPSDDDAMPPDNRRPVPASDVKLIEQWIASGASGTVATDAIKNAALTSTSSAPVDVTFEEVDPAALAKQRANLAPAVAQAQQRLPNVVDYQSRASSDLVVNAAWMGAKFGDEQLAALTPLADRIVSADFSNTAITDKSAATIATMKHLRVLRLMHTRIGDPTVQRLGSLDQLESLSLFDTSVTPSSLPALVHLSKLQRVYAGNTKIAAEAPMPEEIKQKLVF